MFLITPLFQILFLLIIFQFSAVSAQTFEFQSITAPNTICQGSNVTIQCVILRNGVALDTIWQRNGVPVIIDDTNYDLLFNDTFNADTDFLIINITSEDDNTEYMCSNAGNNIVGLVVLNVTDPPMTAPTVIVTPLSITSFNVSWTITDPDHNCIITWTNLRTGVMDNVTVTENTSSYTVTGLSGMDNYNVTVAANNSCGMMMSDPIIVYDPPKEKPIISVKDTNSTSISISWDTVIDEFFTVSYTIRWQRSDDRNVMTGSESEPMYIITGLTPNTLYNITVVAVNTCCGEGQSDIIMVSTDIGPTTTATTSTASTPTPSTTGNGNVGSSNNGPIIGGVVGGIAGAIIVLAIIFVVVYCCICHKRDSTDSDKQGLKSPTGTGGSHTASVQPSSQSSVPHHTADSGAEYAVTTKVNTTTKTSHQPAEEYAMVDKNKKHAAATQGITYADLQALPSTGDKPIGNQGPTATYAQVA